MAARNITSLCVLSALNLALLGPLGHALATKIVPFHARFGEEPLRAVIPSAERRHRLDADPVPVSILSNYREAALEMPPTPIATPDAPLAAWWGYSTTFISAPAPAAARRSPASPEAR
jgi:hypothetical protein